jgi:hypothetical protein
MFLLVYSIYLKIGPPEGRENIAMKAYKNADVGYKNISIQSNSRVMLLLLLLLL